MFTIYAIDRDGHEHRAPGDDCTTLEEALDCLDYLIYEGSLESEPDDPFFVRYGITFTDDGAAEITRQLRVAKVAGREGSGWPGVHARRD